MPLSVAARARIAAKKKAIGDVRAAIEKRREAFVKKEKIIPGDYAGFGVYRFGSSSGAGYRLHGKNFLEKFKAQAFHGGNAREYELGITGHGLFESTRELILTCTLPEKQAAKHDPIFNPFRSRQVEVILGHLALGFEKDALIIEAIKGSSKFRAQQNEFWRIAKQKPLDRILQEAERHARELGFKEVRIRRPETLYYYENPYIESDKPLRQVQAEMRILYGRIAKNNGYAKEEFYYVKKL